MEKRLDQKKLIALAWTCLVLYAGIGLGLFVATFLMLIYDKTSYQTIFSSIIFILLGICLCAYGLLIFILYTREYSVSEHGILLRYLKIFTKEIPWDDISDVSICDIAHNPRGINMYDKVIRIVVGKEKYGPKCKNQPITLNEYERWRTMEYNYITHFRQIIAIAYSKERLAEIEAVYPCALSDYRTLKAKNQW